MDGLVAAHATTLVLAAATGPRVRRPPGARRQGLGHPLGNLDRLAAAAAARGLEATLHPHVGTMVESGEETERVLAAAASGCASTPATC